LRTNFVKGQAATDNINLPQPAKTLTDSSGPVANEDVSVAIKEEVREAPRSQDSTSATITPASGPGETYVAKKNDTYTSIAKTHGMTVKDLKTLNGLKGEQIFEGMELKVTLNGDYTEYDKKFYTLGKGEDSWSVVAKKLNMKTADLKKLNKGLDDDSFRPGKRIRIAQ
jgi:LysM repeat protein